MSTKKIQISELRRLVRRTIVEVLQEDDSGIGHAKTEPAPPTYKSSIAKTQAPAHPGEEMVQKVGSLRGTNPAANKLKLVQGELKNLQIQASDADVKKWLDNLDPSELMVQSAQELASNYAESLGKKKDISQYADAPERPTATQTSQTFRPPKK